MNDTALNADYAAVCLHATTVRVDV